MLDKLKGKSSFFYWSSGTSQRKSIDPVRRWSVKRIRERNDLPAKKSTVFSKIQPMFPGNHHIFPFFYFNCACVMVQKWFILLNFKMMNDCITLWDLNVLFPEIQKSVLAITTGHIASGVLRRITQWSLTQHSWILHGFQVKYLRGHVRNWECQCKTTDSWVNWLKFGWHSVGWMTRITNQIASCGDWKTRANGFIKNNVCLFNYLATIHISICVISQEMTRNHLWDQSGAMHD